MAICIPLTTSNPCPTHNKNYVETCIPSRNPTSTCTHGNPIPACGFRSRPARKVRIRGPFPPSHPYHPMMNSIQGMPHPHSKLATWHIPSLETPPSATCKERGKFRPPARAVTALVSAENDREIKTCNRHSALRSRGGLPLPRRLGTGALTEVDIWDKRDQVRNQSKGHKSRTLLG